MIQFMAIFIVLMTIDQTDGIAGSILIMSMRP